MTAAAVDVQEKLRSRGVMVLDDWLSQCICFLKSCGSAREDTSAVSLVDSVMRVFLDADLYVCADEVSLFPDDLSTMHLVKIFTDSPRILQIDEVVDVGAFSQRSSAESVEDAGEEEDDRPKRQVTLSGKHLLKVCLTDGRSRAVGLDAQGVLVAAYHSYVSRLPANGDRPSLQTFFAGSKLAVRDVLVRRGALMLAPDSVRFLGGSVARLQALCSGGGAAGTTGRASSGPAPPIASNAAASAPALPAPPPSSRTQTMPQSAHLPAPVAQAQSLTNAQQALPPPAAPAIASAYANKPTLMSSAELAPATNLPERSTKSSSTTGMASASIRQEPQYAAPLPPRSHTDLRAPDQVPERISERIHVESPVAATAALSIKEDPQSSVSVLGPAVSAAAGSTRLVAALVGPPHAYLNSPAAPADARTRSPPSSSQHGVDCNGGGERDVGDQDAEGALMRVSEFGESGGIGSVGLVMDDDGGSFYYDVALTCEEAPVDPASNYCVGGGGDAEGETGGSEGWRGWRNDLDEQGGEEMDVAQMGLERAGGGDEDTKCSNDDSEGSDSVVEGSGTSSGGEFISVVEEEGAEEEEVVWDPADCEWGADDERREGLGEGQDLRQDQGETMSAVPLLGYWDQLSPSWSSGSPARGGVPLSETFIRVRGVTTRLTRLKTLAVPGCTAPGGLQFQVSVELDDGHNVMACAVSNDLVERFLGMTAADYKMMIDFAEDREGKKAAQNELVARFRDFHGLFWACPRPKEDREEGVAAGSSRGGEGSGGKGVESVVLIDYAADDVKALCAAMLRIRRAEGNR